MFAYFITLPEISFTLSESDSNVQLTMLVDKKNFFPKIAKPFNLQQKLNFDGTSLKGYTFKKNVIKILYQINTVFKKKPRKDFASESFVTEIFKLCKQFTFIMLYYKALSMAVFE